MERVGGGRGDGVGGDVWEVGEVDVGCVLDMDGYSEMETEGMRLWILLMVFERCVVDFLKGLICYSHQIQCSLDWSWWYLQGLVTCVRKDARH